MTSLLLIKPELYNSRRLADIIDELFLCQVEWTGMHTVTFTRAEAEVFYDGIRGTAHFARAVHHLASGPCLALFVRLSAAALRELVGATNPKDAAPGTLRAMFGEGLPNNGFHASATALEATRELFLVRQAMQRVLRRMTCSTNVRKRE